MTIFSSIFTVSKITQFYEISNSALDMGSSIWLNNKELTIVPKHFGAGGDRYVFTYC
ncbi:hypothetical protein SDC9_102584 [bioreactor metagenome]|jgi:hypothetical protein|uniref:Uncharacterized protein n=1 Tax=bioreactor metagenome TaxID=1076179 RepID=A0A645ARU9_9ZZZZ